MAKTYHDVKKGDTLWAIASANKSSISGSTINAKIDTLVSVNGIKNRDLIYVGQRVYFSSSAKSGTGSGTTSTSAKPTVSGFGLKSDDRAGREMIVNWSWKKSGTAGYTIRWRQYLNGKWTGPDEDKDGAGDEYCQSTFSADKDATQVSFRVRPYKKDDKNNKVYWDTSEADWSTEVKYNFSENPPNQPDKPTVEFDPLDSSRRKLKISYDPIDKDGLGAKWINFEVYKNGTTKAADISKVEIKENGTGSAYFSVHAEFTGDYGNDYKVRAQSIASNTKVSGWSEFSDVRVLQPIAPKNIDPFYMKKDLDGTISVYLEWTAVSNAVSYIIEYTTKREYFETNVDDGGYITSVHTNSNRTSADIILGTDSSLTGSKYYFRVRAVNANDLESDPSIVVEIPVGNVPAAPTVWSTSNSAFTGETMELNWTHNARDGSPQTKAKLGLKVNGGSWEYCTVYNKTTPATGNDIVESTWTGTDYGTFVSYKGELHFKMNTADAKFLNAEIQWKVQTAGVTETFSTDEIDWSEPRTIYIYEKPTLDLTISMDVAGNVPFEDVEIPPENDGDEPIVIPNALTSFPFFVQGRVSFKSENYTVQRPIGYHLRIVAEDYYETVDEAGRTKIVNIGDAVYSRYFDTTDALLVEMSAENVDLEPLIRYTVRCDVDMSTGLSTSEKTQFNVFWSDVEYTISADVIVNSESYTATIIPVCLDAEGNYVENLTLSVYRREYDGTFTGIATNVPNDATAVLDPHPALDYARYRLVAKTTDTGAISFYDLPGEKVGCKSVIVQWDEEWTSYDVDGANSIEGPIWSGSVLALPYNVKISDNRKRDVARVTYAGRQYPVSYHGTAINEGSSWSTVIPKNDAETIYALRRLSLWAGPVYIREPSGMGFWANVVPTFSIDGTSVTIPVTLDVTRVEGGV